MVPPSIRALANRLPPMVTTSPRIGPTPRSALCARKAVRISSGAGTSCVLLMCPPGSGVQGCGTGSADRLEADRHPPIQRRGCPAGRGELGLLRLGVGDEVFAQVVVLGLRRRGRGRGP